MKAGTTLKRFGVLAASVAVTMMMAGVFSKAAVTLSTPNSTIIMYSLTPGGTSAGITPPRNTAVLMMGTNTTSTNYSVGSVNLVHLQSMQLRWAGLESPPSGAIVHGASSTPGTHVVYLDFNHQVDIEILSTDQVVVHNRATTTQAGTVKVIW